MRTLAVRIQDGHWFFCVELSSSGVVAIFLGQKNPMSVASALGKTITVLSEIFLVHPMDFKPCQKVTCTD